LLSKDLISEIKNTIIEYPTLTPEDTQEFLSTITRIMNNNVIYEYRINKLVEPFLNPTKDQIDSLDIDLIPLNENRSNFLWSLKDFLTGSQWISIG
jgi:uncharacterized protein YpuA (DUF1002 family)